MTVRELLARTDSRELAEWQAFYGIDPWGEERSDMRSGTVSATIANCQSGKGKFKASDFMPKFGGEAEAAAPQTADQIEGKLLRYNAMLGGEVM